MFPLLPILLLPLLLLLSVRGSSGKERRKDLPVHSPEATANLVSGHRGRQILQQNDCWGRVIVVVIVVVVVVLSVLFSVLRHSLRFWNAAFFDAVHCERKKRSPTTR